MENTVSEVDAESLAQDLIQHTSAFSEVLKHGEDDARMYGELNDENEKTLSDLQEIEESNYMHRIQIFEGLRLKVKLDERQDALQAQTDDIIRKIDENNAEVIRDSDMFLQKVEECTNKIGGLSSKYDSENIRKIYEKFEANTQTLRAMIEVLKVEYAKKKDMVNFQHVEDENINNLVGIIPDVPDSLKLQNEIKKLRKEIDFIVKHNEELKLKLQR